MELSNNNNNNSPTAVVKTPEMETTPAARKPSAFSNGVLKRHAPLHLHHHPVVVTYRECLKNHAAAMGGHAVDGCGEFMPSPASNPALPTSLRCAACGCHRNFHRRDPDSPSTALLLPPPPTAEFQPHHRHQPPPPRQTSPDNDISSSPSPPPISSSFYPSAPHMLLALSHPPETQNSPTPIVPNNAVSTTPQVNSRKRFRTKFTGYQKEKMLEFADRVGWKMQKRDEEVISGFCSDIGVDKGVFKVWMHNNKNTFGKKDGSNNNGDNNSNNLITHLSNSSTTTTTVISNPPPPPPAAVNGSYGGAAAGGFHRLQRDGDSDNRANGGSSSSS